MCSKTLTSQELLKLIAQDIMIGVSDSVVHFFNSEMDEPVIYDDEWVYKGESCGDEELMEEIITSFEDADNKTLLRLASEWTSLNVSFDDVEFFTLR